VIFLAKTKWINRKKAQKPQKRHMRFRFTQKSNPRIATIATVLIYMILVYTCVHAFTLTAYASDEFEIGGERQDLFETGENELDEFNSGLVLLCSNDSMTWSDRFDYLNNTYGAYIGLHLTANWLDTGYYHVWRDENDIETKIIDWKFDLYKAGKLGYDDISFQEGAGKVLGAIWNSIGRAIGLLTFNIGNPVLSNGEVLPYYVTWLPLMMVLIPWLFIIYWLLPYAIDLLKAIGGLIPFT
jgi:hypothetical protein